MIQRALAALWWSPLRRPTEAVLRRFTPGEQVLTGPLRGATFFGGLAHRLGIYEFELQQALVRFLSPGDSFLDVGAHLGFLSLLASRRVGPSGKVVAFEPLPANLAGLRRNLVANPQEQSRIQLEPVAVGSVASGSITLFAGSGATPTASSRARVGAPITVASTCLDEVAATNALTGRICCKVDVEGAAGDVVGGARGLLRDHRPILLIELHDPEEELAVSAVTSQFGYRLDRLPRRKAHESKPFPFRVLGRPSA